MNFSVQSPPENSATCRSSSTFPCSMTGKTKLERFRVSSTKQPACAAGLTAAALFPHSHRNHNA